MTGRLASPLARVRRMRRQLTAVVLATAALRALTWGLTVVIVAALLDRPFELPPAVRGVIVPVAVLAALVAGSSALWRGRAVRSLPRVALWLEEREPSLRYALVTAVEIELASAAASAGARARPSGEPPPARPVELPAELRAVASAVDLEGVAARAWRRPLARIALGAVLAAAFVIVLRPVGLLRAVGGEHAGHTRAAVAAPLPNRLARLQARVEPPAYARLAPSTLQDPTGVAALAGSRVTFVGDGPADGVTANLDDARHAAVQDGRGWALPVTMPAEPAVLTFHDREYGRPVVMEPLPDSAPRVRLALPANDTTYQRVPHGRLVVEARIADDYGIDHAYLEYMLTAGGGENFATRTVTSAPARLGRVRGGTLRAVIVLDTLDLAPGTVLHIRAVAVDANDVTGPGRGTSETRTLRIAEPVDSTAVAPVPPLPIDSMWMSQRLLNLRTDTLVRARPTLERREFAGRSSGYGNQQEALRQRALAVIGILEADGVGGSFQTETSAKLRRAVDLMWTARMFLGVARPDTARPVMADILAILDEIRLANRYFQRGVVAPGIVDIAAARLKGEGDAVVERRRPRDPLVPERDELARRLEAAVALVRTSRGAALDSLAHLRVAALRTAPDVAAALDVAIEAVRGGGGVEALAAARRALRPPARVTPRDGTGWGGGIP